MTIQDFTTAFTGNNWYAVAALLLMLAIQISKKYEAKLWTLFPVGWRFLVPVLGAMGAAFTHGFLLHESWQQAGLDSLNAIWQIAIPAMGGAAALKESHVPWDGGAGGAPKPDPVASPASPPDLHLVADDDRPTPVDPPLAPATPPPPPPTAA